MQYHEPVLLKESIDGLNVKPDGVYVDVTFGGGGHSREILSRLQGGTLIVFDQDEEALQNIPNDDRVIPVHHNFRFMKNFLKYLDHPCVDGIIADLGVSSHHFDVAERGFSFRFDGRLDMRMNQNSEKDAAYIVNSYDEATLLYIFNEYGEVNNARKLVGSILEARSFGKIESISDFVSIIKHLVPAKIENKYLAQVFQALRMEVNQEVIALKEFLTQVPDVLIENGRISVITYHSIEDRLVKNFIKAGSFDGLVQKDFYGRSSWSLKPVNKNVIIPSDNELKQNSRSRSAKLRVAERLKNGE